jgi:MFS family permease
MRTTPARPLARCPDRFGRSASALLADPNYVREAVPARRGQVDRWLALTIMLIGPFLGVIDFFIANIGIATIRTSLHANFGEIELVVAGYGLTYAVCLITGGRLGDIHGRKRIFILGLIGFTTTSAWCGLAPDGITLVVWRLLQGCSAAIMFPQALSFIHVNFSGDSKRLAFSVYGAMIGFGAIFGQILGGFLIQANIFNLGWRPIFLINLPIGAATILAACLFLQESQAENAPRLDPVGTVLLSPISLPPFVAVHGRGRRWLAFLDMGRPRRQRAIFLDFPTMGKRLSRQRRHPSHRAQVVAGSRLSGWNCDHLYLLRRTQFDAAATVFVLATQPAFESVSDWAVTGAILFRVSGWLDLLRQIERLLRPEFSARGNSGSGAVA